MVMGAVGNEKAWKRDLFPKELIPEILELVVASWNIFSKPDRLDHEVSISKRFTRKLRTEKNQHYDLPFKIWYELPEIGTLSEDEGRIDILFSYIGTPREDIYFAFECKRLRIPYPPPGRFKTNNSDYVNEQGMMCFVTGKYSESVANGGMIGYVMDGKTEKAVLSVGKLIKSKNLALKLAKDAGLEPSSVMGDSQNVRETRHILSKRNFTIHHIFLAV
jgi:hypothetical protein